MQGLQFSLTPHKLSLAILVQDLCQQERVPPASRHVLSIFLLEQVRQASDCNEKSLSDLCLALSALQPPLGVELAQQLVETLQEISSSPDDLFDTLISLESLLLDVSLADDEGLGLDSSAVLGLFVRRVLLRFHTSLFEGLSRLFLETQAYVGHFLSPGAGGADAEEEEAERAAHAELAAFVPHHAGLIESSPPALQLSSRIDRVLRIMGNPPAASYLRYVYAVQQLDLEAALDHLHRFFDYAMLGRGGSQGQRASEGARERPAFQWALLNLAGLHFRFGSMGPALKALEETVRLAQHGLVHSCVGCA